LEPLWVRAPPPCRVVRRGLARVDRREHPAPDERAEVETVGRPARSELAGGRQLGVALRVALEEHAEGTLGLALRELRALGEQAAEVTEVGAGEGVDG